MPIQIFEELVRSIRPLSEEKKIQIELNHDQEVYMMYGDYDRLRQMFLVILDNAVKFSVIGVLSSCDTFAKKSNLI